MLKPTNKSADLAVQRFLNFVSVARPSVRNFEDAREKIYLFSNSTGLEEDVAQYIMEEIASRIFTTDVLVGPCYIGVCLGLIMADHAYELKKKEDGEI